MVSLLNFVLYVVYHIESSQVQHSVSSFPKIITSLGFKDGKREGGWEMHVYGEKQKKI